MKFCYISDCVCCKEVADDILYLNTTTSLNIPITADFNVLKLETNTTTHRRVWWVNESGKKVSLCEAHSKILQER